MIIAVDLENKFTTFGVYSSEKSKNLKLISRFSLKTDTSKSTDELALLLKLMLVDREISLKNIKSIIISCVVPDMVPVYTEISKKLIGKAPIFVSAGVKTGLNVKCENPKEVGSDRVARAVSATHKYEKNLLIISASSITTIDFVNERREFIGGLIIPGIDLWQKSLFKETSKLPKVEIINTDKVLGNSTIRAMQSGLYYGYKNSIMGILEDIFKEYKLDKSEIKIILTGMYADFLLEDNASKFIYEENLALDGLKIIYEKNLK
ncbi:type III pantothenate kinase [Peptoniphilus sp.]|jgi:type III pantothenate kinase|uniref:type III pantothenate kinase n=1 Tax=Peptoniphilus sp. TaxID=1971214 RepID=UPI003D8E1D4E